jgi:hypothetical protein
VTHEHEESNRGTTEPAAASPAPGASDSPSPLPVQLGQIAGDRLCTTCGFNLFGQSIVREPHYGVAMVRCPECSAAAALSEYPSLGHWSGRLTAITVALYSLGLLGLLGLTVVVIGAMSKGASYQSASVVAREIAQAHIAYQKSRDPVSAGGAPAPPFVYTSTLGGYEWDTIELAWWNTQAIGTFVERAGGPWRSYLRRAVEISLLISPPIFALGVVWSVVFHHLHRRWLVVFAAGVVAFGAAFRFFIDSLDSDPYAPIASALDLAEKSLSRHTTPLAFLVLLALLLTALLVGRPIVRGLIRVLLHPRHRGVFGFLWSCDGLAMPGTRPR